MFNKISNYIFSALPERDPEIRGLSSNYAVGENVTANCTAWPSIPIANMHWSINGKTVRIFFFSLLTIYI